ncbi:carboxyl transferase [Microbacterium faecale]|uniref:Carboxyl transferase n=1 Tax=Microbacterium faecale TaxID=1804630 RepID=A0A917DEG7_9MICO|nr:carboxyl transferase domain-containing protein [Microbacterium faecale]GGD31637.1 carboxyl transferase [Microbacterium faecale]
MGIESLHTDLAHRRARALAGGPTAALENLRAQGRLNARERVEQLLDTGTFTELGLLATAPDRHAPADGKITGLGEIDGRTTAVASNDFTVLGASSSPVNNRKMRRLKDVAGKVGAPIVFLGESAGGRMPDTMGATSIAGGSDRLQYQRIRRSPWVSAVLGSCYGSSAWYASISDFTVMRKGATLGVASARLISVATGQSVDSEDLGGWRVHTEVSGLADVAVDTDEQAIAMVKQFLSYLPSNSEEAPPLVDARDDEGEAGRAARLLDVLPESLNKSYDMHAVLECIVDSDSLFPLKRSYGKSVITTLARIDGQSVGIVASNPMSVAGAITAEACSKVISFLVLCDSYNIPLVFLADQPGFLIGLNGERKGITGRVMNWMHALTLCTVPIVAIVARKSYGAAVGNMGLSGIADHTCAWTTAELSFMNPDFGARVLLGEKASDPEAVDAKAAELARETTAYDAAASFAIDDVIDPRETRAYLRNVLRLRRSSPIGEHLMAGWPTSY